MQVRALVGRARAASARVRSLLPSGHRLSLTPSPSLLSRRYSITIEATDKSELKLETIIGKVKAAVQVDHHGRSGDGGMHCDSWDCGTNGEAVCVV